jgi:hypothetical protein
MIWRVTLAIVLPSPGDRRDPALRQPVQPASLQGDVHSPATSTRGWQNWRTLISPGTFRKRASAASMILPPKFRHLYLESLGRKLANSPENNTLFFDVTNSIEEIVIS